jgi:hypothetical protein
MGSPACSRVLKENMLANVVRYLLLVQAPTVKGVSHKLGKKKVSDTDHAKNAMGLRWPK